MEAALLIDRVSKFEAEYVHKHCECDFRVAQQYTQDWIEEVIGLELVGGNCLTVAELSREERTQSS